MVVVVGGAVVVVVVVVATVVVVVVGVSHSLQLSTGIYSLPCFSEQQVDSPGSAPSGIQC